MRFIISIVIVLFVFSACHRENGDKKAKEKLELTRDNSVGVDVKNSKVVYRVPTPIEFFMFYRGAGGAFNPEILLSPSTASNYLSTKNKAVAFGMYASDLAYSAVFAQNQQTISYFEASKVLAEDLGFTEGYGEELMQRFKSNLDNVDSLYHLSADSYWNVLNFLEDQDKTTLLSYITAAGWVESLYLAFNAKEVNTKSDLMSCLADQQYVIENLDAYLQEMHKNETDRDDIFLMVRKLNEYYAELYNNPDNVIMTRVQFDSIKSLVNRSRESLVKR